MPVVRSSYRLLALCAFAITALGAVPEANAQRYRGGVTHMDPGNERVRITLSPAAAWLQRGESYGASATLNVGFTPNVWLHARGYAAYPFIDEPAQYSGELMAMFVRNQLTAESQQIVLQSSSYRVGNTRYTHSSGVNVPSVARHLLGFRAGARYYDGFARLDMGGSDGRTSSQRLDLVAGVVFVHAVDTAVYVQGYGNRSVRYWKRVGVDLLYAPWSDTGLPVTDDGKPLGARITGAFSFGRRRGFGIDYELGLAPRGGDFYASVGLGVALAEGNFGRR